MPHDQNLDNISVRPVQVPISLFRLGIGPRLAIAAAFSALVWLVTLLTIA